MTHLHRVFRLPVLLFVLLGLIATSARAAAPAEILPPYVTERTVIILRVDVAGLDTDTLLDWLGQMSTQAAQADLMSEQDLRALQEQLDPAKQAAAQWKEAFVEAGGREMYLLVATPSATDSGTVLLASTDGVEVDETLRRAVSQVAGLLYGMLGGNAMREDGGNLLVGAEAALAPLPVDAPQRTAALEQAFALVEPQPIQMVAIPPTLARRALEESFGQAPLPEPFGGGVITNLTQGLQYAALAIAPPPGPSLRLVIQTPSEAAAHRLQPMVEGALGWMRDELLGEQEHMRARPFGPQMPEPVRTAGRHVFQLLTPQGQDDQLVVALDDGQVGQVVQAALPVAISARHRAKRVAMTSQVRQIMIAAHTYVADHKAFPPDLTSLVPAGGGDYITTNSLLVAVDDRPLPEDFHDWPQVQQAQWVNEHMPWVYVPGLAPEQRDIAKIPVVFERQPDPRTGQVIVAFGDGSVTFMEPEELDARLREKTGVSYEQWQKAEPGERPVTE